MPQFKTTRRVAHPARSMFDLVADVARYPEFLPYCIGAAILRRSQTPEGLPVLLVQMTVGYDPIRESFVSRATFDAERLRVHVQYVDGPFKWLENRWVFHEQGEAACDVDFFIDYAFKSRTFEMLAGSVFERLFKKMADAFVERADALAAAERRGAGQRS